MHKLLLRMNGSNTRMHGTQSRLALCEFVCLNKTPRMNRKRNKSVKLHMRKMNVKILVILRMLKRVNERVSERASERCREKANRTNQLKINVLVFQHVQFRSRFLMFILSQFSYGNECLCVLLSFPRNTFHRLKCFCAMKTVIISSFFALVFGFVYVARPIFVFSSLTFEDIMQSKSKVWMDLMHLNSDMNFSQCCS